MKKKIIVSAIVLLFVFEIFTSFFTKLFLSALTGVTDSDDLEVILSTGREYFLPTAEHFDQPIEINNLEIYI